MKLYAIVATLILAGIVSASCMYDTTFGSVRCFDASGNQVPKPSNMSFAVAYVGITILPNGVNNVTKVPRPYITTATLGLTILPRK